MMKNKIIFLGSSEFAVPALEKLNKVSDIKLVITQPDKKSGRGNKVNFLPVKKKALELGLNVYQPDNVSSKESLDYLRQLDPDFLVVCSYGQLLKPEVLALPKKDTLNIHASLLPSYRGASPIQTAIVNGDDKSGVTIMKVDEGMDTGDILLSKAIPIDNKTTAEHLHDQLADLGADLLLTTLMDYESISSKGTKQDGTKASYTKKIEKTDALINWNDPADKIIRHINAFDSFPGAYSLIDNKKVKFFNPELIKNENDLKPGQILFKDQKNGLVIATKDGTLKINEIQFPGKRRMKTTDFFKGNTIEIDQL